MREIKKEEFIERCKKSVPYPLGDKALADFYGFLKKHQDTASAARLLQLCKEKEERFDGHPVMIFDSFLLQLAFRQMCEDLPKEFYDFSFNN